VTGRPFPDCFNKEALPAPKKGQGYSLAQKIIGRPCDVDGGLPGTLSNYLSEVCLLVPYYWNSVVKNKKTKNFF
jgi:hypothetical protein